MRRCIYRRLHAPTFSRIARSGRQWPALRTVPPSRTYFSTPLRLQRLSAPIERIQERLAASDLQGASEAHDELLRHGSESSDDGMVLSRLVQALCLAEDDHEAKIRQIMGEFRDRGLKPDGKTTAALIFKNLKDGWNGDVEEALEQDVVNFSNEDKRAVVDVFRQHIVSPRTSTTAAWEGYLQLHTHLADSISVENCEALMETFFARKRSDMACAVLSHLSHSATAEPNQRTFLVALNGVTQLADEESLKVVHNLLKVSVAIEPNTELSNALMRAYMACSQHFVVWDLWNSVADSLEGPNYETIVLALQACAYLGKGYGKALSVMERLKLADVPVNDDVIGAYAGVLARQDRLDEAIRAVEKWKGTFSGKIGVAMYAAAAPEVREKISEWVAEKHPETVSDFEHGVSLLKEQEEQMMLKMFSVL